MTYKQAFTQRDVARAAGVTDMTVSRVLRGTGTVSARTKAIVLEKVREMGYVPNRLAGSLAESRSNQVGVIIPSLTNSIFNQVTAGIAEELGKAGYNPVVGISDYDIDQEEDLIESMLSWRPAGFIVADFVHTDRTRNMLRNSGIPVVEMMEIAGDPIDMCVGFNHADAARTLTEHLLEKGYRRFGFLGWKESGYAASTRYLTIRDRLREEGLPLVAPNVFSGPPDIPEGKSSTRGLLESNPEIDVIIYGNDTSAAGGMFHCLEQGIDVPQQVAIAGFSGLRMGQALPRALTTISFRRFDIGRRAAKVIINSLVGLKEQKLIDMGFELIVGESS